MAAFQNLSSYEKGLAARSLLEDLAKRGRLDDAGNTGKATELIVPLRKWHLELLECISQETLPLQQEPNSTARQAPRSIDEAQSTKPRRWLSWCSIVLNP